MSKRKLTVSASESGILRYPHLLSEPGVEDWGLPRGRKEKKREREGTELSEDEGREPKYQETPVTMVIIT